MARSTPSRRTTAARPRHALRPRLDPLEGRLLLAAGDLDPTFGTGGLVTTAFFSAGKKPVQTLAGVDAVEIQVVGGREKILAAGNATNIGIALARYNLDGTLDASFGTGGKVATAF